jgi:hypothetical protein
VEKLDLEASISCRQALDSQSSFEFEAAHLCPSDEAFGARSALVEIPEESPSESMDGSEEGRGKLKGPHSIGWQSIEHDIQQHNPTAR